VNHEISLQEASQLTARFQENLLPGQPKGGFFGKQALQRLLDHPECVGLRFFYGAHKDGKRAVVGMCVDKFGAEMFHGPSIDLSGGCPPFCGAQNLLNHGMAQFSQRKADFVA
jgi:hypothetical protein